MGKAPVGSNGPGTKTEFPFNGGWGFYAKAQRGQPQPNRGWKMADGKSRGDVRGMMVMGINLTTLFPIPLTTIPLTLDSPRKMANRESCRKCATLTHCSAESPRRKKLFASSQCKPRELRIFGKIFPPLFSLCAPVQVLWLRLAALGPCAFALDSSCGLRIGPNRGGGGLNGGGIRHPVSNPSILYSLSMIYNSIAARMPLCASFDDFEENQPK